MKFLLAQINPVVGDLEGNAKKILNIASKACSISADFVLTPELSLWGYPANDLLLKKNLIKNQCQIIDQLAFDINKKYGNLSITVGIAEIINDSFFPNLYNSIAFEPAAQAVDTEELGPFAPKAMAANPVAMFGIIIGTVNGLTLFGPLWLNI